MKKKGQLSLDQAPTIIILVGLTFLILATFAYIGLKYGDALAKPTTGIVYNETITTFNDTVGDYLSKYSLRNAVCSVVIVTNETNGFAVNSANYTLTGCLLKADSGSFLIQRNVNVTYRYSFDLNTVASNVTDDFITEIKNNTSIVGMVMTISLVGIVLAVLIGIFVLTRRRRL